MDLSYMKEQSSNEELTMIGSIVDFVDDYNVVRFYRNAYRHFSAKTEVLQLSAVTTDDAHAIPHS